MPKAYFYAGLTLLMWATVATAFKLTLHVATVLQTLWVSTLVSSFTLLVILCREGGVWRLISGIQENAWTYLARSAIKPGGLLFGSI